jgi:uncharacterized protein YbjT (DUF2867 family)
MTRAISTILAVGAAGKYAGLVVPELVRRGVKVRGLIRDAKQGDEVRKHGVAEVVVGDLRDRASVDAALKGVDSVFYIAPAFIPDEAQIGKGMVDAAKKAGVRRFVFSSVIHPILYALENHSAKGPVEEAILESDMEYAILHPAMFFQNFAASWPAVVKTGVFSEPWSMETHFSRVDYRDVAEVAAIALAEQRLLFGTYELCAEGNLNGHDVAALMGEVIGKKVKAAMLTPINAARTSKSSSDGKQMPAIKRMFQWYDNHSLLGNSLILRAILGHEPRTLRAYFEELTAQSIGHGDLQSTLTPARAAGGR